MPTRWCPSSRRPTRFTWSSREVLLDDSPWPSLAGSGRETGPSPLPEGWKAIDAAYAARVVFSSVLVQMDVGNAGKTERHAARDPVRAAFLFAFRRGRRPRIEAGCIKGRGPEERYEVRKHGKRTSEVVQRGQGVRFHHAGRRRGRVRSLHCYTGPGLQNPGRGRQRRGRGA